jgi:hypothetical protein
MTYQRISSHISYPHTLLDTLTLDVRQTIQSLTYIQLLYILLYISLFAVFMGVGAYVFTLSNRPFYFIFAHGTAISVNLSLAPLTHTGLAAWIFGSSFERVIRYHRWLGKLYIHCANAVHDT